LKEPTEDDIQRFIADRIELDRPETDFERCLAFLKQASIKYVVSNRYKSDGFYSKSFWWSGYEVEHYGVQFWFDAQGKYVETYIPYY
jgi:hypothetical protein